ncbi:MAG: glycosyltransferase family 4 protein [Armatimonadetes bacterium]|nr:glycosyltransferase family 4 protein [Armatimonadota bacterium]
MKLLYVSTLDHIVRVMLPHLDGAKAAGYETHVACQFTRFKDDVAAHADGLHHVPIQRNPLDPRNMLALVQLVKLIRKLRPDIVHCHNPSGGFYGRLAATLAKHWLPQTRGRGGLKRVYTAHGFHFHPLGGRLSNALYRAIESFAGRFLSDAVLTINQWDFEEAKKLMPPERVYFTHGVGVSTDEFDPATVTTEERQKIRDELGVPEDGILISTIGELIPRKGHRMLLEALKQVTMHHHDFCCVIVGDGILEPELQQTISKYGLEGVVRLVGFRRDTKQILAASNIFVFSSLQEGLPCAVQEALSMEIPVVALNIRGCADLLNGLMWWNPRWRRASSVPWWQVLFGGNGTDIAQAILQLLAHTEPERQKLGRAGRQKMIEHYSRPVCVAEWLEIYNKISPHSQPPPRVGRRGRGRRV